MPGISTLHNIPDLIPVYRQALESWDIRVFNREEDECFSYISPNRRSFYKILLVTRGSGSFAIGLNSFNITGPAILFIHPTAIISWKHDTTDNRGYYCLFKRSFLNQHPQLQNAIERLEFFSDPLKNIIELKDVDAFELEKIFVRLYDEDRKEQPLKGDAMQALLQLLLIESQRIGRFAALNSSTIDYQQVHNFFQLLEEQFVSPAPDQPIELRTAKEFAARLNIHPNYLNALLKQHTGQNISTHIRDRILDEAKAMLKQTDWSVQDIGYSLGFADGPNFNLFFKKNTGVTPLTWRKAAI